MPAGLGTAFAIEEMARFRLALYLERELMLVTTNSLFDLTANDLMSREVVCLHQEMTMQEAARLLILDRISGAPVVDGAGKCVGVISTTDFFMANHSDRVINPGCGHSQCVITEWASIQTEDLPLESVREYMTADPVTVPPSTSIGKLAQRMIDAHIHRIIVVDAEQRPTGIVTSTDLLAALAYADSHHEKAQQF
jgi:CBS domain-containing protein